MIGIYLLKQGEKVVYVGSSEKVETRITQHQNDSSKTFDSYQVIGCKESELCNLESYYIEKYKPIYNKKSRIANKPDYSGVFISTANKYDKEKVLSFVKECLFFYSVTPEDLSFKFSILLEDSRDLFLCRTIIMDTLTTYFSCKQKDLIYDDVVLTRGEFHGKEKIYGSYILQAPKELAFG